MDIKICAHCDTPFTRRPKQKPSHFNRRTYCSISCGRLAQRRTFGLPPCLRCGTLFHSRRTRGLCTPCRKEIAGTDELLDYPAAGRPSLDTYEEWQWLRSQGVSKREAARQLGMTFKGLDRALYRALKQLATAKHEERRAA